MSSSSKKKTFADALTHPDRIPPPTTKPTAWESYLIQEMKKLQAELTLVKQEVSKKDEYIADFRNKVQELTTKQVTLEDNMPKIEETTLKAKVNPQSFSEEVLSVIKEKERVKSIETHIRVGGLPDGWDARRQEEDPEEEGEYCLSTDILTKRLSRVVPFIDLGEPMHVEAKGKQAKVHYYDMREKIAVMKQTRSLQGTSVWISDELTPIQLKNRSLELAKVREARRNGKWAVYRGGKAIIRDFVKKLSSD